MKLLVTYEKKSHSQSNILDPKLVFFAKKTVEWILQIKILSARSQMIFRTFGSLLYDIWIDNTYLYWKGHHSIYGHRMRVVEQQFNISESLKQCVGWICDYSDLYFDEK